MDAIKQSFVAKSREQERKLKDLFYMIVELLKLILEAMIIEAKNCKCRG